MSASATRSFQRSVIFNIQCKCESDSLEHRQGLSHLSHHPGTRINCRIQPAKHSPTPCYIMQFSIYTLLPPLTSHHAQRTPAREKPGCANISQVTGPYGSAWTKRNTSATVTFLREKHSTVQCTNLIRKINLDGVCSSYK
jgi:hypothetical protein